MQLYLKSITTLAGIIVMSNRDVNDGFIELAGKLSPQYSESEASENNINIIEKSLKSNFEISYMVNYGSVSRGTHINGYSAFDCFAVVPKKQLYEDANKSLEKVWNSLNSLFPDSLVTNGRPVVSIPFGQSATDVYHIVPAFHTGMKDGYDLFNIPAPRGRWIETCPGGHSAWLNSLNEDLSQHLKKMIRVVKGWNYFNGQPLWSFYIELAVAEFMKTDYSVMYSHDFRNFLKYILRKQLEPIKGSVGCYDLVYATSKEQKNAVLNKISDAIELVDKAVKYEKKGDVFHAYYWWRKVFNFHFPSY